MSIYCGVDIVEVNRIKKSIETCGDEFLNRVFTDVEINYCESKKAVKFESYAARFAAKEAVSKAFGTGFSNGLKWTDIEIVNDEQGKPHVNLYDHAKEIYIGMNGIGISLSLTHSKEHAIAYAIIEA
jgi:holo-[acyl-carrier protein] synthase